MSTYSPGIDLGRLAEPAVQLRSRRNVRRGLATQFALVATAALAYFGVRGLTEGSAAAAAAHGRALMRVEHTLRIDVESSLQGLILGQRYLITAANWVYIWGHWPAIAITLVWLYRNHRDSYFLLRNSMFVSGAIGLVIFMTFPVAPPRLMSSGFVDTVTELSTSYRVLQPPALINEFAAVPSLHVGWNLLVGIILYRASRAPAARLLAVAGPVLMALAVVITANHYVVDVAAGALVALVGLAVAVLAPRVLACIPMRGSRSRTSEPCVTPVACRDRGPHPRIDIERAA